MKTCIKKIFCPACQKMVRCHEQKVEGKAQILCGNGHPLRVWNGVRWQVVKEE